MIITAPDSAPFVPGFTNNVAQDELDRCGFPAIGNQAPRKTTSSAARRRCAAREGNRSERLPLQPRGRRKWRLIGAGRYLPAAVTGVRIDQNERRFAGSGSRLLRPKLMARPRRFVRRFLH